MDEAWSNRAQSRPLYASGTFTRGMVSSLAGAQSTMAASKRCSPWALKAEARTTAPSLGDACTGEQADAIAFLESGDAFGGERPRRIDTHAASIFLVADRAWKLKRAVKFDYLDFSTADKRRAALEIELRLNRRNAPDLYRAVHPITRDSTGRHSIDGQGEPVDWLLEMRRFPDDALLEQAAGRGLLDQKLLMRLADRVNAFHNDASAVFAPSAAERFRDVIEGNVVSMRAFPAILEIERVDQLAHRLREMVTDLAPLMEQRNRNGRVRHGHGDLHLSNIAIIDGEPTLFDCIEFSSELATVDVLYDLAFLLMDLWQRDLRTEANIVFNRYLDLSPADETGLALMPLFLAARAMVRTHVLAAQAMRRRHDPLSISEARAHLDLAFAFLEPAAARCVAIGGLSGTGKSTLSRAIGGSLGRAPGARILRSDVLRKRVVGFAPEIHLPPASYTPQSSVQVYSLIRIMAAQALASGQAVIADGVFSQPEEREAIAAVAQKAGVAFDGLWLQATTPARIDRISGRGPDASDADVIVANAQANLAVGSLGDWKPLSAHGSLEEVAANARAALGLD